MSFANLRRIARASSFRLTCLYAVIFSISVAVLGNIIFWTVETALERHITTRISAELAFLETKFRTEGLAELVEEVEERMQSFVDGGHMEYLVVSAQGERLAGNLLSMPAENGWSDLVYPGDDRSPDGIKIRVRSVALDGGIRLAVGDDLEIVRYVKRATLGVLGWVVLAIILLSVAGGFLVSLAFLRKVDSVTQTAGAITSGNLNQRIPLRGTNDEFDRLSAALNQMLDHNANLMESLRQVSNDIAHDLRTPLTRLRQKLDSAQAMVASIPARTAIEAAVAETDEILETFSALLRISQIEAGSRRAGFREVDLTGLFETVTDAFGVAAEAEGKNLIANVQQGVRVTGDKELLTQMLANLVENAIRHTPENARIEITLAQKGAEVVASVADDGHGVPHNERKDIFRRFYRVEPSRTTPGNGLGLALVQAVANLHGIELEVGDNTPGLRITMSFNAHLTGLPQSLPKKDLVSADL